MKLKLDLHPIFNDSASIERSLNEIIDSAIDKRADEVEVIPGKGSGALKKTVLRFLDRPEIKAKYHRIEKDSDNFGRLFIHFRHPARTNGPVPSKPELRGRASCFCCDAQISLSIDPDDFAETPVVTIMRECPACGSPNRITVRRTRQGELIGRCESGYE